MDDFLSFIYNIIFCYNEEKYLIYVVVILFQIFVDFFLIYTIMNGRVFWDFLSRIEYKGIGVKLVKFEGFVKMFFIKCKY